MNSHDRRVCERAWPHAAYLHNDGNLINDCTEWLNTNFGSCRWTGKRNPRWCYRPDYVAGPSFTMYRQGLSIFFRKDKDYVAFLLKWDK